MGHAPSPGPSACRGQIFFTLLMTSLPRSGTAGELLLRELLLKHETARVGLQEKLLGRALTTRHLQRTHLGHAMLGKCPPVEPCFACHDCESCLSHENSAGGRRLLYESIFDEPELLLKRKKEWPTEGCCANEQGPDGDEEEKKKKKKARKAAKKNLCLGSQELWVKGTIEVMHCAKNERNVNRGTRLVESLRHLFPNAEVNVLEKTDAFNVWLNGKSVWAGLMMTPSKRFDILEDTALHDKLVEAATQDAKDVEEGLSVGESVASCIA
eukprot:gnl/TRDRNA2_/TRDRNA2_163154_c0_seq1.p1 gnl/TRDRNA2_/TRDRNA2_163154_c0~~gnl/TRDRNA2_/TRDRNA2_163154_c0_seq1.p1  ORF type:complete len:278 (+),score=60.07 gnl/TRDRNA2_/TRDRNA2_163154_c0_seq1:28-834(+)